MNFTNLCKPFVHFFFRTRQFNNECIKKFAKNINRKTILEIGSGKKINNEYYYSAKKFFNSTNKFVRSDINREFGHKIIDIADTKIKEEYDIVLCMNVLEHIYDYRKAIDNIYKGLKYGGTAVFFVPVIYPFHDEPNDYWRFTEHSLVKLLEKFNSITIKYKGLKKFPFAYYIEAEK